MNSNNPLTNRVHLLGATPQSEHIIISPIFDPHHIHTCLPSTPFAPPFRPRRGASCAGAFDEELWGALPSPETIAARALRNATACRIEAVPGAMVRVVVAMGGGRKWVAAGVGGVVTGSPCVFSVVVVVVVLVVVSLLFVFRCQAFLVGEKAKRTCFLVVVVIDFNMVQSGEDASDVNASGEDVGQG